MPTIAEQYLKTLETDLKSVTEKLRADMQAIRGNRPSADLISEIKVNLYDQWMTVKQLGSLSVIPPRSIQVSVWDKDAVGAVVKAIDNAKIGLSVTNDGNNIIATLSQLGNERREELMKLVKKTSEGHRIQIRAKRDEAIKKLKAAEDENQANEDEVFKTKERMQKFVDETNKKIEEIVDAKLKELGE
ncbi:MAG: ribosome recycling factor [Patescibacteria group bacterium]|nr:ribosome recycling factor [Patescibacteria group bacterium]MDE2015596.1 ribosome recycling factor [Patescibacteria group bacterium]MDE2226653.1 ribosome recycling factor [Patescibacteria group bacterium]